MDIDGAIAGGGGGHNIRESLTSVPNSIRALSGRFSNKTSLDLSAKFSRRDVSKVRYYTNKIRFK